VIVNVAENCRGKEGVSGRSLALNTMPNSVAATRKAKMTSGVFIEEFIALVYAACVDSKAVYKIVQSVIPIVIIIP
jgi:hypothetical protein